MCILGVIIFYSVRFLSKKSNQTEIFFYKKTETGRFRFGSVRFFRKKTDSNQFDLVFFPGFFRFGFFSFTLIKPKPNWSVFSKF